MEQIEYGYILNFLNYPVRKELERKRVPKLQSGNTNEEMTKQAENTHPLQQMSEQEIKSLKKLIKAENSLTISYY